MWSEPTKERLSKIPALYETENVCLQDKLIHLHFFVGACDWYIAEYDGEDLFWGFVVLNGDYDMAEWGYISFEELKQLRIRPLGIEVDCENEIAWQACKASEIEQIRRGNGWEQIKIDTIEIIECEHCDQKIEITLEWWKDSETGEWIQDTPEACDRHSRLCQQCLDLKFEGQERTQAYMSDTPPGWFDPADAGERWDADY